MQAGNDLVQDWLWNLYEFLAAAEPPLPHKRAPRSRYGDEGVLLPGALARFRELLIPILFDHVIEKPG